MNSRAHPNPGALEVPGRPERLVALVSRFRPATIGAVCGVAIAVFVVLGSLQRMAYPQWAAANLDSEVSVATWFAAALLWAAAALWLLVAVITRPRVLVLWIWWPVLAWLALDEGNAFHERLERWSGIDWQVLYLPLISVAAVAWWGVLRRHRDQWTTVALLAAGALAWAAALFLELVQNWGGSPAKAAVYVPAMITEEALEMVGSTVFLIAAMLVLRQHLHRALRIRAQ